MPTKADIIRRAHRRLSIVSAEESVSADQEAYAADLLDDIHGEYSGTMTFSITTPSASYLRPLSDLLAVDLAPHYMAPPPMSRAQAVMALRGALIVDDRDDSRDVDDDGTVTDEEAAAAKRAEFY